MENASKALIIAGGVLISAIIISIFMMFFNNIMDYSASSSSDSSFEEIESFNRFFLYIADNGTTITGIDALNVFNKVWDINNNFQEVTISFNGTISVSGVSFTSGMSQSNYEKNMKKVLSDKDIIDSLSKKKYTYEFDYDDTGRINSVSVS